MPRKCFDTLKVYTTIVQGIVYKVRKFEENIF